MHAFLLPLWFRQQLIKRFGGTGKDLVFFPDDIGVHGDGRVKRHEAKRGVAGHADEFVEPQCIAHALVDH